jgi:hypothetical protein
MTEHKLLAILSANGILAGLTQAVGWLDPVLRILLLLAQIGVALVTIMWILHKIKKDK